MGEPRLAPTLHHTRKIGDVSVAGSTFFRSASVGCGSSLSKPSRPRAVGRAVKHGCFGVRAALPPNLRSRRKPWPPLRGAKTKKKNRREEHTDSSSTAADHPKLRDGCRSASERPLPGARDGSHLHETSSYSSPIPLVPQSSTRIKEAWKVQGVLKLDVAARGRRPVAVLIGVRPLITLNHPYRVFRFLEPATTARLDTRQKTGGERPSVSLTAMKAFPARTNIRTSETTNHRFSRRRPRSLRSSRSVTRSPQPPTPPISPMSPRNVRRADAEAYTPRAATAFSARPLPPAHTRSVDSVLRRSRGGRSRLGSGRFAKVFSVG